MAEHLYTFDDPPSEKDVARTVRVLKNGGVLAYPTDLNWAFGCDASNSHGLDRLYRIKPSHSKEFPFSLIVSSISMAAEYVYVSNVAYRILRKAWPGPYTVLMSAVRTLPRQLKDKRKVFGMRIPNCPLLLAIVNELGCPLASTSVPRLGLNVGNDLVKLGQDDDSEEGAELGVTARFGYEVFEEFGHALDLLLDLGHELPGQESTIIDLTTNVPQLLRLGAGDPKVFPINDENGGAQ